MSDVRITAEVRTEFGKGAARRARRAGRVPAVVYGHGAAPVHLTLPGHELMLALKTPNVLITLDVDGKSEMALPKAVQKDPIKGFIEHVDLLTVKRGEKVTVEIPIQVEGDLAPGALLIEHVLNTLPLEAEATDLPTSVTVSVEGMGAGDTILARDIALPSGSSLAVDEDTTVIHIVTAQAEEPTEGGEAAEAAEATAEA